MIYSVLTHENIHKQNATIRVFTYPPQNGNDINASVEIFELINVSDTDRYSILIAAWINKPFYCWREIIAGAQILQVQPNYIADEEQLPCEQIKTCHAAPNTSDWESYITATNNEYQAEIKSLEIENGSIQSALLSSRALISHEIEISKTKSDHFLLHGNIEAHEFETKIQIYLNRLVNKISAAKQ